MSSSSGYGAAIAAGLADTYAELRERPGWTDIEAAFKQAGLIYKPQRPPQGKMLAAARRLGRDNPPPDYRRPPGAAISGVRKR